MIKAAVLVAEKEISESIIARVYLVLTHHNGVSAAMKTEEIEFKDPDGLLDGKSIVAHRSTDPITKEGISEWDFLDGLGMFNRIGSLVIVKDMEAENDTGSDNTI